MDLRVISHSPTINSTGVYRNASISATFDKSINHNTIDYTTFSVNDHNSFTSVPGTYSVEYNASGEAITAVLTPTLILTANTKYDAYIFGTPDSILAIDGSSIPTTYVFSFTTGINELDETSGSGVLPSGEVAATADPAITALSILSTAPQNQEPNVATSLEKIRFTFNTDVASSPTELSGLISLAVQDVLY